MRIGAIVQARMGSRLPGKVLLEAAGKTLLEHLMGRLGESRRLDFIVVATSTSAQDDCIDALCRARRFVCFRGSEQDVLDRYYQAARAFRMDVVVRITADCPLIDPDVMDEIVGRFLDARGSYDLVTNRHPLTFPDGLDVDVMSFEGLSQAWANATTPAQREHTVPYFWEAGLRVLNVEHPANLFLTHRWTLDYWEDYLLIKAVLEALDRPGRAARMDEILAWLAAHPEVSGLNAHLLPTASATGARAA